MFGLVILGLFVLFITSISMVIGANLAGLKGVFLGFILTISGFIIYWTSEYIYIKNRVARICESGRGITVYITPEEWRKQVGEEYWDKLVPLTTSEIRDGNPKINHLDFNKKRYKYEGGIYGAGNLENSKLGTYYFSKNINSYLREHSHLFIDKNSGTVLLQKTSLSIIQSSKNYKYWIEDIQDCSDENSKKFHKIAIQYSNTKYGLSF